MDGTMAGEKADEKTEAGRQAGGGGGGGGKFYIIAQDSDEEEDTEDMVAASSAAAASSSAAAASSSAAGDSADAAAGHARPGHAQEPWPDWAVVAQALEHIAGDTQPPAQGAGSSDTQPPAQGAGSRHIAGDTQPPAQGVGSFAVLQHRHLCQKMDREEWEDEEQERLLHQGQQQQSYRQRQGQPSPCLVLAVAMAEHQAKRWQSHTTRDLPTASSGSSSSSRHAYWLQQLPAQGIACDVSIIFKVCCCLHPERPVRLATSYSRSAAAYGKSGASTSYPVFHALEQCYGWLKWPRPRRCRALAAAPGRPLSG